MQIGTVLILIANGFAVASAIIARDVWFVVVVLGIVAFDIYLYYFMSHRKKEPRYPLVPPEGKPDIYLPRTNIPRPVHQDLRRMQEKKRRVQRIEKLRRKKKQYQ